jgi:competence protein ComEA
LGLSVKQANVVANYRKNGGKFYRPDDFKKVYVIDSVVFRKLEPWIRITTIANEYYGMPKVDSLSSRNVTPIIVELNSTDTLELVKVKGIGRVFARRIIAYRNLLGGYVDIHQLNEVYGIKKELVSSISAQIAIDTTKIRKIDLNQVAFEDLKKHPYISDYQAKAIVYYRSKVEKIKDKNELIKNKIIPNEKYQKIKSYLTVN